MAPPIKKQPEPKTAGNGASIPDHASDWLQQFAKHLELYFADCCDSLTPSADRSEYQWATIRAIMQTLQDSGMSIESICEMIGQVVIEQQVAPVEWSSELNQRRFALIDREIQGDITPVERIELSGLTRVMREHLDSETNLPLAGARVSE
jgi:hypothetical protein